MYGIELKNLKKNRDKRDSKYKYELLKNYIVQTKFRPVARIVSEYIELGTDGLMFIKKGYQFDGPSGISVDTDNFMRGSLVHDCLYQLMDEGKLCKEGDRLMADKLLYQICRSDGMSWFRANYVYKFVRWFGGLYVKRKIKSA